MENLTFKSVAKLLIIGVSLFVISVMLPNTFSRLSIMEESSNLQMYLYELTHELHALDEDLFTEDSWGEFYAVVRYQQEVLTDIALEIEVLLQKDDYYYEEIQLAAFEAIIDELALVESILDDAYYSLVLIDVPYEDDEFYYEDEEIEEELEEFNFTVYSVSTMEEILEIMVDGGYVTRHSLGVYTINTFYVFVLPYYEIDLQTSGVDLRLSMRDALDILMRLDGVSEIIVTEDLDYTHSEIFWEHQHYLFRVVVEYGQYGNWYIHDVVRSEDLTIRSSVPGELVIFYYHLSIYSSANLTLIDAIAAGQLSFGEHNIYHTYPCNTMNPDAQFTFISNDLSISDDIIIFSRTQSVFEGNLTTDHWFIFHGCDVVVNGNLNYVAEEFEWRGPSIGRRFPFSIQANRDLITYGNIIFDLVRLHESSWYTSHPYLFMGGASSVTLNGNINVNFDVYFYDPYTANLPPRYRVAPIFIMSEGDLVINGDFITSDSRAFPDFRVFGEGRIDVIGGYLINPNFYINCWFWNAVCYSEGIHVAGGTLLNPSFYHRGEYDEDTWERIEHYNISVMSGGTIYGHQPYFSRLAAAEWAPLNLNTMDLSFVGNEAWCDAHDPCYTDGILNIGLMTGGTIRPLWMYYTYSVDDLHVRVSTLSGGLIQNSYTEFDVMNDGTINNLGLDHDFVFFEENNYNCRVVGGRYGNDICFYSSVLMNESVMNGGFIYGASIQFIGDVLMNGGTIAYATSGALFSTDVGSHFTMTNGIFRNNSSKFGAVSHITGGIDFTIYNGRFENNHAEIGGVFYLNPLTRRQPSGFDDELISTLTINNGIFEDNSAELGGVIAVRDFFNGERVIYDDITSELAFETTNVIINDGIFTNNEALNGGVFYGFRYYESIGYSEDPMPGGWVWVGYEAYIEYCLMYGDGYGGFDECFEFYHTFMHDAFEGLLEHCLDWEYWSTVDWYGVVYNSLNDCIYHDTWIWLPQWGHIYPPSYFQYIPNQGLIPRICEGYLAGVLVQIECEILPLLAINDGEFENNEATHGGVIYLAQGMIDIFGGIFTANYAINGGVIYINEYEYLLEVQVIDVHFAHNEAYQNGGAIYIADVADNTVVTVAVQDSTFYSNTAINGMGGAIHVTDWNVHETRTLVTADYLSISVDDDTYFSNNSAYHQPTHPPLNPEITAISAADTTLFDTPINNFDISFYYTRARVDLFYFTKTEIDNQTPLPGAVFNLYRWSDVDDDWDLVDYFTSDADGIVNIEEELTYDGLYRLIEIDNPDDFVLPPDGHYWLISVSDEGIVATPTHHNGALAFNTENGLSVPNMPEVTLRFTKTNDYMYLGLDHESLLALSGAVFTLQFCPAQHIRTTQTSVGNPYRYCYNNLWSEIVETTTSSASGLVTFDRSISLDGVYRLVETVAPSGFRPPAGYWTVFYMRDDYSSPGRFNFNAHGIISLVPAFYRATCPTIVNIDDFTACDPDRIAAYFVGNFPIILLPATGGLGAIGLTIMGGLVLSLVMILYIRNNVLKEI